MEDKLREAAALGDIDGLRILLGGGADVNDQHKMNKWTALHWAAKRNAGQVVRHLLQSGADDKLADASGRLAGDLTTDPEIMNILTCSQLSPKPMEGEDAAAAATAETEANSNLSPAALPFTPSYLKYPVIHKEEYFQEAVQHKANGNQKAARVEPGVGSSGNGRRQVTSTCHAPPAKREHVDGPASPAAADPGATAAAAANQMSPMHHSAGYTRILKLRMEGELDFIEADLSMDSLAYQSLIDLTAAELGIKANVIKYLRKLPNTRLRRDLDVIRLTNYQEIEVVLKSSSWHTLGSF